PGDQAVLDVDLPAAGAGAVHPVRGAHDLVVLPPLAVGALPRTILERGLSVTVGETILDLAEEHQAVEKVTHWEPPLHGFTRRAGTAGRSTGYFRPGARVIPPRQGDADQVEHHEQV